MDASRDILFTVSTLARLIRVEADKRARAHGMTRAQWVILVYVGRQPGMLQKELAEVLEVEPISVARLVDRLEARGMVERRADPNDRRCWRLHLTQTATPLLGEIQGQLDDLAYTMCLGTDCDTRRTVADALNRMRDSITTELRNAPARPAQSLVQALGGEALDDGPLEEPTAEAACGEPQHTEPTAGIA